MIQEPSYPISHIPIFFHLTYPVKFGKIQSQLAFFYVESSIFLKRENIAILKHVLLSPGDYFSFEKLPTKQNFLKNTQIC